MPVQTENDYSSRKETPTPRRAFSKPVCASKERDALMTAKALLLPATTDAMYTQLWDSFLVNKRVSQILYLAVPGRNRTLIRCIFRLHYRVRSTVTQNFIKGGAHTCRVNVSSIHEFTQRICTPPVMEVLCYSGSNALIRLKYAME